MTRINAMGRLFPAALFTILFLMLSVVWLPDPVLMALGVTAAGFCVAWLIVTTVDVARLLSDEPSLGSDPAVVAKNRA